MRILQKVLFGLGVLAFLASAAFVGGVIGDSLWRAGVACLLVDLVLMKLCPPAPSA